MTGAAPLVPLPLLSLICIVSVAMEQSGTVRRIIDGISSFVKCPALLSEENHTQVIECERASHFGVGLVLMFPATVRATTEDLILNIH